MIAIRLFGRAMWSSDGGELVSVPPALQPLLGYLLLHRHTPLPRDLVAAALWPEVPDQTARTNLRRRLHRLRASLPPAPDPGWLQNDGATIQWQPQADYWLDIAAFEQASASREQLAEACELYRGDLLLGCYDDWVLHERERWRNLYLTNLEQLVRHCRAERDYAPAIAYATRLLSSEPLHENAMRLLMSVRYEAGDGAGAVADYQRFAARLEDELGTPPMVDTTALYLAIQAGEPLPTVTQVNPTLNQPRFSQQLPLVGRAGELATLEQLWVQAGQGQGSLVLVSGEAGIGKSRLATVVSHMVEGQGGRVLRGHSEIGTAAPYQAIVTALRPVLTLLTASRVEAGDLEPLLLLLPDLARYRPDLRSLPTLDAGQQRDRLYRTLRDCLAQLAVSRPLLLILEDLHLAGVATFDWLRFLGEGLATLPLLVVVTYRETEVGRDHPLRDLRRSLPQGVIHHLSLPRLDAAAVASLCASLRLVEAGLIDRLHQESEGNPFVLNELIANLEAHRGGRSSNRPTALMIQTLIGDRLHRLQANTRLVAEAAATVGSSFSVEVVQELTGRGEAEVVDAIFELLDVNLLNEGLAGEYRFSHHLIQEAIYAALDPAVRSRRHRRLAQVLAELYPDEVAARAATLARHCKLGGDPHLAVSYYQQAATYALSLYADEEALAAISSAMQLSADPTSYFDLLAMSETIYARLGRREEQVSALTTMRALTHELADPERERKLLYREIVFHHAIPDREAEAAVLSQLEFQAQASGDVYWQAIATLARAEYQFVAGELDDAKQLAEVAIGLFLAANDLNGQVRAYCLRIHCASRNGNFAGIDAVVAEALQLAGADNLQLLTSVLYVATSAAYRQLNFVEAEHLARQALELAQATHDRVAEADVYNLLAGTVMRLARYHEALDYYQRASTLFAYLNMRAKAATVLGNIGLLHSMAGRTDEAVVIFHEVETIFRELGNLKSQLASTSNLADVAVDCGRNEEAQVHVARGLALLGDRRTGDRAELLMHLGRSQLGLGQPAVAAFSEAAAIYRSLHNGSLTEVLEYLVAAHLAVGDLAAAQSCMAETFSLLESAERPVTPTCFTYLAAACVARSNDELQRAATYIKQAHTGLMQKYATSAARLGDMADQQWRSYQTSLPRHAAILNAYERGVWPAWASLPEGVYEEVLPPCRYCELNHHVSRAGMSGSGNQRYRCAACQHYFTTERKARGHTDEIRQQAVLLHREGHGVREIARQLAVSHRSVSNWLKAEVERLAT